MPTSNNETPAEFSNGVAALVRYDGKNYLVKLPREDAGKFEAVWENGESKSLTFFAHLRDCLSGTLGGKVDPGETPQDAIKRESLEEIQSFGIPVDEIEISFKLLEFEKDFVVLQFLTEKNNELRGAFKVEFFIATIGAELFSKLMNENLLFDFSSEETIANARPLAQHLYKKITAESPHKTD